MPRICRIGTGDGFHQTKLLSTATTRPISFSMGYRFPRSYRVCQQAGGGYRNFTQHGDQPVITVRVQVKSPLGQHLHHWEVIGADPR